MSSFYNGSLNKPCILDLGNTTTKIGYAGEDSPLMYWDSLVHVDGASVSRELGVPRIKGGLNQSVNRPERGETPDEDGLWSRTVGDGLVGLYGSREAGRDHPMLLVDSSQSTAKSRADITELMFETHGCPMFFLGDPAVLSCFAVGKTTAVVVDVKGSGTTVSAVADGWLDRSSTLVNPVGGDRMDDHFLQTMEKVKGKEIEPNYVVRDKTMKSKVIDGYHAYARRWLGRQARESVGGALPSGVAANRSTLIKQSYSLPDGTTVELGDERYDTAELLFGNSNEEREAFAKEDGLATSGAIQHLICDAVFKCPRDQQAGLLSTVVLAGGGICVNGAVDRLRQEVENIVHTHTPGWRVKVMSPGYQERKVQAWLGGSILGSLVSFQENWMSKAEYDEHGAAYVNRKCP